MYLSAYACGLYKPERLCYEEKVRLCDGVDPLELKDTELQRVVGLLPCVDFTDIKDYLVHGSVVSHEQLKLYKSMEGHNYLTSGWVQQPFVKLLLSLSESLHSVSSWRRRISCWTSDALPAPSPGTASCPGAFRAAGSSAWTVPRKRSSTPGDIRCTMSWSAESSTSPLADVSGFLEEFGQFDRLYSFYCLHWVDDLALTLKNVARLITPTDECLLVFYASHESVPVWRALASMDRWKKYSEV
ncbi:hypothetical protein HPB49_002426 [Dermacentor silvarum]|uniref:Uncharacterized protein n=1 Tax=Dermacentor silvarum TaxID=543639 RepID=A0ACB8C0S0_DERSI|nr:hypothetical protein HPB49_002426 [Dermacentor silvarum]